MKANQIIIILSLFFYNPFLAKSQLNFKNSYWDIDTSYSHAAYEVLNTADHGYLILADRNINDSISIGTTLLKLSATGDTLWSKNYDAKIYSLIELPSRELVSFISFPGWSQWASLVKLDTAGNIIQIKDFNNFNTETKYLRSDGSYLFVAGYDSTVYSSVVVKLDFNLTLQWADKLTTTMNCWPSITLLDCDSNGNIIVAASGSAYWSCPYIGSIDLFKLNSQGNVIWSKNVIRNDSVNISVTDIKCDVSNADKIILTGRCFYWPGSSSYSLELDSAGNMIYSKGHFLAGAGWQENASLVSCQSNRIMLIDFKVLMTDDLGNAFSTINDDYLSLKGTYDSGLVGIGTVNPNHSGIKLAKLDSSLIFNCDGNVSVTDSILPIAVWPIANPVNSISVTLSNNSNTVSITQSSFEKSIICDPAGISETNHIKPILIFPNPFNDVLNIYLDQNIKHCQVSIFNMMGAKVFSSELQKSQNEIKFNPINGIYLVLVTNGRETWSAKVTRQ